MRRVILLVALIGSLAGCGFVGGSDDPQGPVDVETVEDVNADLMAFRCVEQTAGEGGDDAEETEGDDDAGGWTARGHIENSSPLVRSYLVIAYAGEPGVEVEASTLVVEAIDPNESQSFRIDDVAAQPGAEGCFVRLEEFTGDDE